MHDDDRVQSSCVSEFRVVPGVGVNLEDAKAFVKQSSLRHGCTVLYHLYHARVSPLTIL